MPDYIDETVRIADLAESPDALSRLEFVQCVIQGPMVIMPMQCRFVRCEFGSLDGSTESVVWEIPAERWDTAQGAVRLVECAFVECKFVRIGVALIPAAAQEFRDAFADTSALIPAERGTSVVS